MRLWKQIVVSLAVVGAGVLVWGRLAPGAGDTLKAAGLPDGLVAWVAPSGAADGGKAGKGGQGNGQRGSFGGPTLVVTKPVQFTLVNDRLSAIGDGEAIRSVIVTPYSSGNLTEVLVKSGDRVKQSQLIAQLDDDEQKIAADQARLTRDRAADKLKRYENLHAAAAVTVVAIQDARDELKAAELALQKAELDLSRRAINAPYAGIVGIISVNPGDYVTTSSEIARVDDRTEILVDFWVPERFVPKIRVGGPVSATAIARPGEVFTGAVQAVDNRIDQASRTLRVRARIDNPDDVLRAGMSFSVTMHFQGDRYPSVDPLALQWSADGSYVWRIVDDKAEKVPVKLIQRNPDKVLVDAELAENDAVATEGLQRLRDGSEVKILNAGKEAQQPSIAEGT
ncbi:efflux RND transporter periplasmic adaptor subunit [Rhizobium sp. ARZ01]|uniref:efflux RND transporter periplasmic adaptor subunit n=1 Tax=Rhizobium sp. ARZ01 TaxID=2769313 RepID=UPI001783CEAD|nr:efflux RND transporter periplasmic adaptor subunit [Rhizobium sp. ARZ01]MBD9372863.1 efflux RND transporter periplasmic adaptor subunit [Rhizobium sp. ARZ01]